MKFTLLVVGRTVEKHYITAINDYVERTKHYVSFDMEVIPELKNTKSLSMEQQKEKEGEAILKALQPGDVVVLLDEHGKEFRSIEFANWIERKMHTVNKRLVFIIGGPYGFSPFRLSGCPGKDFPFQNDILTPDDTAYLRGTALPGHDHSEQRPLPPRINRLSQPQNIAYFRSR